MHHLDQSKNGNREFRLLLYIIPKEKDYSYNDLVWIDRDDLGWKVLYRVKRYPRIWGRNHELQFALLLRKRYENGIIVWYIMHTDATVPSYQVDQFLGTNSHITERLNRSPINGKTQRAYAA